MNRTVRRVLTTAGATVGTVALFTGTAAAHYCVNESAKGRAGEAYALFGEADDPIEVGGIRLKGDRVVGGNMVDLYFDVDENGTLSPDDVLFADNFFTKMGLPVSALKAAGCGRGVGTAFPEEFDLDPCT